MRGLHLAELRDSWSAWLGVCVGFIAINFTLALSALAQLAGVRAVQSGALARYDSSAFAFTPALNLVFCAVVGAVVRVVPDEGDGREELVREGIDGCRWSTPDEQASTERWLEIAARHDLS